MNQALVATRVAELRDRISRAGGVGVGIVAVTKTFTKDAWNDAKFAGCEAVGENYAQELIVKSQQVDRADRLPVHFIGQLQTNKIKSLFDIVDVDIHCEFDGNLFLNYNFNKYFEKLI